MIIGDPGSGKTTLVLDLMANLMKSYPDLRLLFVSVEMNEIDLASYVRRYPTFNHLNILFIESQIVSPGGAIQPGNSLCLPYGGDTQPGCRQRRTPPDDALAFLSSSSDIPVYIDL